MQTKNVIIQNSKGISGWDDKNVTNSCKAFNPTCPPYMQCHVMANLPIKAECGCFMSQRRTVQKGHQVQFVWFLRYIAKSPNCFVRAYPLNKILFLNKYSCSKEYDNLLHQLPGCYGAHTHIIYRDLIWKEWIQGVGWRG